MNRKKLTKAERQEVYDKCGGHCAYCGCELKFKDMQVDHVVPMARCFLYNHEPKTAEEVDVMSNYLPACRSCNHYKGTSTLENFRKNIERFPQVLMRDSVTYKNAVRYRLAIPNAHKVVFYFEKLERGGHPSDEQKESELLEMLNMCAKDDSDNTYQVSSVSFLATEVLEYIAKLKLKIGQ